MQCIFGFGYLGASKSNVHPGSSGFCLRESDGTWYRVLYSRKWEDHHLGNHWESNLWISMGNILIVAVPSLRNPNFLGDIDPGTLIEAQASKEIGMITCNNFSSCEDSFVPLCVEMIWMWKHSEQTLSRIDLRILFIWPIVVPYSRMVRSG